MSKKKVNPIDDFEKDWMADIEAGKIKPDSQKKEELAGKLIVDQSLKKAHPVSLRIPDADLEAIQLKAAKEGIPYQTLIKSVLHKFATNQLET
ncbi:MAG: CopG family antitoxin [SAR324 cluster bacterium]|nr:CopG family antitoxin [SAR324 cluster bacterium]